MNKPLKKNEDEILDILYNIKPKHIWQLCCT